MSPAERLRLQSRECARLGSPLYAGLLARAAADFEAGGATRQLLGSRERDPAGSALALRLMGAVHRLVLSGDLPELAALYADPERDAEVTWRAFAEALASRAEALRPLLERPVQTNEVGRCAALLAGFLTVAARTALPLSLLELGSSAGLNLLWDHFRYRAAGFEWGPSDSPLTIGFELKGEMPPDSGVRVAERRGCDAAPLDPGEEEGRLTLLSYLWADQPERAERTRAALALAAAAPPAVDRACAPGWLAERLVARREGVATVVFHSIVFQYLSAAERATVEAALREAGGAADSAAPLAWLRMEPAGPRADLRLTLWPPGEELLLGSAGYHGNPVVLR